jgi:hypothetical protein
VFVPFGNDYVGWNKVEEDASEQHEEPVESTITRLLNERIASKDALKYDPLFFHQEQYVKRKPTKENVDESDNPKVAARATKLITMLESLADEDDELSSFMWHKLGASKDGSKERRGASLNNRGSHISTTLTSQMHESKHTRSSITAQERRMTLISLPDRSAHPTTTVTLPRHTED